MKLTYSTSNGRISTEIEGTGSREVFEQLAEFQEVFEIDTCGKCGCKDIRYTVRKTKDEDKYYELRCTAIGCRAKFLLGVPKKGGGLFPKRKDAEGKWLEDGGWVKWNAETQQEE